MRQPQFAVVRGPSRIRVLLDSCGIWTECRQHVCSYADSPRPTPLPPPLTKTSDLAYGMCIRRCGRRRPRMAGMPADPPHVHRSLCRPRGRRRPGMQMGAVICRCPVPTCPPPRRASCCQGTCEAACGGRIHGKTPVPWAGWLQSAAVRAGAVPEPGRRPCVPFTAAPCALRPSAHIAIRHAVNAPFPPPHPGCQDDQDGATKQK